MASDTWEKTTADEVRPGDRVRLQSGEEVIATRIESMSLAMFSLVM